MDDPLLILDIYSIHTSQPSRIVPDRHLALPVFSYTGKGRISVGIRAGT